MSISAMKQALEALDAYSWEQVDAARAALRQALAEPANSTTDFVEPKASSQPEQDPVAYEVDADVINSQGQSEYRTFLAYRPDPAMATGGRYEVTKVLEARPLYTAPPKREWVGLSVAELSEIDPSHWSVVIDIDAKLKEKNG